MTSAHPSPRRILIVRLSALGDIVMSSGLIPALHKRFPQAELYWLTEAGCAPLLKHNPKLKDVLIWPRAQWEQLLKAKQYGALWREIRAFRKMLRSMGFHLVLDGQGLLKSGLCAWFTGAPRRISIIAREGSHLLVHERVVPPAGADTRIGSEYRYLATYLGAPEADFQHDLAVGEAQRMRAREVLRERLQGMSEQERDQLVFYNCGPAPMVHAAIAVEREFCRPERIFSSIDYLTKCGVGICGACATPDGRRTLFNRELTLRHRDGTAVKRELATPDELLAVLAEHFDLPFPAGTRFAAPNLVWPA